MPAKEDVRIRLERGYIPVTETGCWLWLKATDNFGYGRIGTIGTNIVNAHRVSYELHKGKIPKGMCVCHTCDVPSCINPAHLFLGTKAENSADMALKKRSTYGEKNPMSKLTESDVKNIFNDNRTQQEIANDYGIKQQAVSKIKLKLRWRIALCQQ